jgi:general secretion pathway protein I
MKPGYDRPRAGRGFTLIEMMVATILLVIGVVATLSAVSSATHATAVAEETHTAALLAQQQMTQIELQPDTLTGGDQQGDFGDSYPGFRWQQSIEPTEYQDLFKVTVTVLWGTPNSPHSRAFTTYMRNPQLDQSQTQQNQGAGGAPGAGGGGGNGQ